MTIQISKWPFKWTFKWALFKWVLKNMKHIHLDSKYWRFCFIISATSHRAAESSMNCWSNTFAWTTINKWSYKEMLLHILLKCRPRYGWQYVLSVLDVQKEYIYIYIYVCVCVCIDIFNSLSTGNTIMLILLLPSLSMYSIEKHFFREMSVVCFRIIKKIMKKWYLCMDKCL